MRDGGAGVDDESQLGEGVAALAIFGWGGAAAPSGRSGEDHGRTEPEAAMRVEALLVAAGGHLGGHDRSVSRVGEIGGENQARCERNRSAKLLFSSLSLFLWLPFLASVLDSVSFTKIKCPCIRLLHRRFFTLITVIQSPDLSQQSLTASLPKRPRRLSLSLPLAPSSSLHVVRIKSGSHTLDAKGYCPSSRGTIRGARCLLTSSRETPRIPTAPRTAPAAGARCPRPPPPCPPHTPTLPAPRPPSRPSSCPTAACRTSWRA